MRGTLHLDDLVEELVLGELARRRPVVADALIALQDGSGVGHVEELGRRGDGDPPIWKVFSSRRSSW